LSGCGMSALRSGRREWLVWAGQSGRGAWAVRGVTGGVTCVSLPSLSLSHLLPLQYLPASSLPFVISQPLLLAMGLGGGDWRGGGGAVDRSSRVRCRKHLHLRAAGSAGVITPCGCGTAGGCARAGCWHHLLCFGGHDWRSIFACTRERFVSALFTSVSSMYGARAGTCMPSIVISYPATPRLFSIPFHISHPFPCHLPAPLLGAWFGRLGVL